MIGGAGSDSLFGGVTSSDIGGNQLDMTGPNDQVGTGNSGNDYIYSSGGYDTIVSGSGIDVLSGLATSTFVINNSNDVVLSSINSETNFESSVSYTLAGGAATLTLIGSANIVGVGGSQNYSQIPTQLLPIVALIR